MSVAWFNWIPLELAIPPRMHIHLHTLQPGYTPAINWKPFTLAVINAGGWIILFQNLKKNRESPEIAWRVADAGLHVADAGPHVTAHAEARSVPLLAGGNPRGSRWRPSGRR